ncbi:hypothetical protein ASZ90_011717 [hydrocarbon metagenome]|uniref:Uncharacterized protein n=1 Tax=hydrocarbon metagenome TaxID=938273 RepID=A0A0W8FCH1_9ZZZZ
MNVFCKHIEILLSLIGFKINRSISHNLNPVTADIAFN